MNNSELIFTDDMTELHGRDFYYSQRSAVGEFNVIKPHMHMHYELYYLTEGTRRYFIKNKIYTVSEGDFIFISPNTIHHTAAIGVDGHERILLNFTENYIEPQIREAVQRLFDRHCISISNEKKSCIKQLFKGIAEEYNAEDKFSKIRYKSLLNDIFITLLRNHQTQSPIAEEKAVPAVLDFVDAHMSDEITVADAAHVAGLSRSHFSRVFPEMTGFTFNNYLKIQRLERARQLLEKTNESITSIAFSCGFTTSSYFATVFRNCFGITPIEYRKQFLTK